MELDIIQKKFFCVLAWHDVFRSRAALKRAYTAYKETGREETERMKRLSTDAEKMFEWSHYMVDTFVIENMFEDANEVNKLIRKLINNETFQALWPEKCSRFHVFKSKKDCMLHIEEQLDLFKDQLKAIVDAK